MTTSAVHGTLYDDWLARRTRLREYHGGRESIVAVQLRVLDYLIERYRDNAAALELAPPTLDTVYINQRAIVINHHRSLGLVAGVKSKEEAGNRVAAIVARMYDSQQSEHSEIDLARSAVAGDPWFGWEEPSQRQLKELWSFELTRHRRGKLSAGHLKRCLARTPPFLPRVLIEQLGQWVERSDQEHADAAEALAMCRNRVTVSYVARAWRIRIAAQENDAVTYKLREALSNWGLRAADNVRCLLADESAAVRMAAAGLLPDVGELRDIGIIADLLSMPTLPDEEPDERLALAHAMEKLAKRLDEDASRIG